MFEGMLYFEWAVLQKKIICIQQEIDITVLHGSAVGITTG
jgi:hypothetical protein